MLRKAIDDYISGAGFYIVSFYVWMRRLTLQSSLNVDVATRIMYFVNVFQKLELVFFMYFVNVFWRTGRRSIY
jgi:hypothetical protein